MKKTLIQAIAARKDAYHHCFISGNEEWRVKHYNALRELEKLLPHGSGIDAGSKIDIAASTGNKVYIETSYHHMDDAGCYDGWTEHVITVTPSFSGINIDISGENRNDILDYLGEVFYQALQEKIPEGKE